MDPDDCPFCGASYETLLVQSDGTLHCGECGEDWEDE